MDDNFKEYEQFLKRLDNNADRFKSKFVNEMRNGLKDEILNNDFKPKPIINPYLFKIKEFIKRIFKK